MIAIVQEKLAVAMTEIQALLPAQWEHTGDSNLPCEPSWNIYSALETQDKAALFLARRDGCAIGYAAAMYHPHLNSREVWVGSIPTYYVEEGLWRAVVMRELLTKARDWCLGKGAKQVFVRTEYNHSAGKLLERMGFTPNEIGYKLTLSGAVEQGHA